MNTTPPTDCRAWGKLAAHAEGWRGTRLAGLLQDDPERAARFSAEAPGVRLDYSRQRVGGLTLQLLAQLASERGFDEWRAALLSGKPINTSEERAAWHTALRAGDSAPGEVKATLARMKDLSGALRNGGKCKRIINLGTGGSSMGPRLLCDALGDGARLEARFVANLDALDLERALQGADPAGTLFVVVSKSFATEETMANADLARRWGGKGFYAVTANPEAARKFGADEILPMWDWVGGRFSLWSAAGFSAMCALGPEPFDELLAGAREMDLHFAQAPLERNVPALLALLGIWNVNFLGAATHAVLPYSHRLRLLPAFLQQLEMESNGKSVDREGRPIGYATAPVVWGMEGTPSQHSFHQLLHQGTQAVPVDFIVAQRADGLDANAEAQAQALARGNRPSSTLRLERLDARNLGRLIALYEHKVFAQGVIWNINSFDQPGVELGKRLAWEILSRRR